MYHYTRFAVFKRIDTALVMIMNRLSDRNDPRSFFLRPPYVFCILDLAVPPSVRPSLHSPTASPPVAVVGHAARARGEEVEYSS